METLNSKIENASSLSFSHNRNDVDVFVWNADGERILTIRNCSADLFLEHFDYGTTIFDPNGYMSSDSQQTMIDFLKKAI